MRSALVCIKHLDDSKSRLAFRLSPQERRDLGLAMMIDVLSSTSSFDLRLVITSDPQAAARAAAGGFRVLQDPARGLNAAVEAGVAVALEAGGTELMVLPADIPLVTSEDLEALVEADAPVAISRSRDGGTTGLRLRPPGAIAPAFGPNSALAHQSRAVRAGLESVIFDIPNMGLDVDDYEDVVALAGSPSERESAEIARRIVGR